MVGSRSKRRRRGLVESSMTNKQTKKPNTNSNKASAAAEEEDDASLKVFLNPLIMDQVIKHLPLRSLPKLRSTCKLWNKLMAVEYRERKSTANPYMVVINNATMDSGVFATLNQAIELPFSAFKFNEFIQMESSTVQKLVDKIGRVMTRLQMDLRSLSLPIETFRSLLFVQCPLLARLGITDDSKAGGLPSFWKSNLLAAGGNEEEEIKTLPHLKSIGLGIWSDQTRNQVFETSNFCLIRDLLNSAINLETLKIYEFLDNDGVLLNGVILDILLEQQQSGQLQNKIKNIKLGEGVTIKNLEALVELSSSKPAAASASNRLKLKKLDLRRFLSDACFMDPQGVELMNKFLKLQAPSLEKFKATLSWRYNSRGRYKITLPAMPLLNTLKLQMEFNSPPPPPPAPANANANNNNGGIINNGPVLPNIRFDSLLTNFPSLQKLKLLKMDWMMLDSNPYEHDEEVIYYQARKTAFMAQLGSPHHGITDLDLRLDAEDSSSYLIDYGTLFPAVKSLTVTFPTQFHQQVWSTWPELELLNIHLLDDSFHIVEIDSYLTGIPNQSLEFLKLTSPPSVNKANNNGDSQRKMGKKKKKKKELVELGWKTCKTQAGISDLYQLHTFNLYAGVECIPINKYMSDVSAHYGFIPTANNCKLRRIYIQRCSNFSREVVAAVEGSLGLHGDFVPFDERVKRRDEERSQRMHQLHHQLMHHGCGC